ncbi:type 1 glutamine amidotransferase domain-containing protein [Spirosoma arcticum]
MSTKAINPVNSQKPKRIAIVLGNPSIATTIHAPVGFWWSELTHPYYAFTDVGYEIELFSPKGGKLEGDQYSDPRDPSGYSEHDLISMGFINTPKLVARLDNTRKVSEISLNDFDAIMVAGGQSPMFTFQDEPELHQKFAEFYEAGKIAAALCHGTSILRYVKLSSGEYLVKGKTVTGFANVEEDFSDAYIGQQLMPWRIEDELKKLGANYVQVGLWREFAIREGNLITGQQNYSGAVTARVIIEALGL